MAKNTVRVNVVGDASSLKRSMGEAGQATDSLGRGMSTFAKIAVAALAVKALGAVKEFVGDSKRAFVDLQESLNAVEVVFGKNGEAIKQLGREAATSIGLSNAEFNSFAVSTSNFAKTIAGDSGDVVEVVKDLTGRIADFASVMNLDVNVAAEKFQSGLAGQPRPLREFGINVDEATVKAYAMANGIGEVGRELTESEKVQARYGTIMEQTAITQGDFARTSDDLANATRIANAQMENSKAIVGQALKGAYQAALPLQVSLAKAAAATAIAFMELTGQITEMEAQVLRFNQATGGSVDTLGELTGQVGRNRDHMADLRGELDDSVDGMGNFEDVLKSVRDQLIAQPGSMDLVGKSAQELRHEAEELGRQYGWTRDQTQEFIDMLLFQQEVQSDTGPGDMWLRGLQEGAEATAEVTEETEEATETLRDFFDLMDSRLDSLRGLRDAQGEVAEKQEAVNEAHRKFGEDSPEYIAALDDLSIANQDLREAQRRLIAEGGLTRAEFIAQQVQMGLTYQQALTLSQQYDDLFTPRHVVNTITNKITNTVSGGGGGGILTPKAKGGPVKKGEPYWVGEEGPEPFIPDQNGTILPTGSNGNGSAMGGISIVVHAGMGADGSEIGRQVVEAIRSYERQNGAAWRAS